MEGFVKGALAVVGTVVSWMVGGFGLAFSVLLGLMLIDFITGLMAAIVVGPGASSSVGKKGAAKKVYILLLIAAFYLLQMLVPELQAAGYAGDGLAIMYCILEFVSIVENGGKLGAPIGPLRKVIAVLKPEKGDRNDSI